MFSSKKEYSLAGAVCLAARKYGIYETLHDVNRLSAGRGWIIR